MLQYVEESGRWDVLSFLDGTVKGLKESNLKVLPYLPFEVGRRVRIDGLQSASARQYNGTSANIVAFAPGGRVEVQDEVGNSVMKSVSDRWDVRMDIDGQEHGMKETHLT